MPRRIAHGGLQGASTITRRSASLLCANNTFQSCRNGRHPKAITARRRGAAHRRHSHKFPDQSGVAERSHAAQHSSIRVYAPATRMRARKAPMRGGRTAALLTAGIRQLHDSIRHQDRRQACHLHKIGIVVESCCCHTDRSGRGSEPNNKYVKMAPTDSELAI